MVDIIRSTQKNDRPVNIAQLVEETQLDEVLREQGTQR